MVFSDSSGIQIRTWPAFPVCRAFSAAFITGPREVSGRAMVIISAESGPDLPQACYIS